MVREWSENDITNLMHGVAQGVRHGRISRYGWDAPATTFNEDKQVATSDYRGAAGEGSIEHMDDGTRHVVIGALKANLMNTLSEDGVGSPPRTRGSTLGRPIPR